jgi:hypothetical protein
MRDGVDMFTPEVAAILEKPIEDDVIFSNN